MALLKFRKISLSDWEALTVRDANTRYTVFNSDGSIYAEFIGDEIVSKDTGVGIIISEEEPDDMKDGDLWFKIIN